MPMTTTPKTNVRRAHTAWRMAQHAMFTAALLTANTAEAWTLNALLRLPLERLMELRVAVQHTAKEALAIQAKAGVGPTERADRVV